MKKDKRQNIGAFGETLACDFLKKRGYKIIDRNARLSYLEIDIIAKTKQELVFIEVKTRISQILGPADEALKNSQIKNLKKAIVKYCAKNKQKLDNIRLDLISVNIILPKKSAKIKHFKNIF